VVLYEVCDFRATLIHIFWLCGIHAMAADGLIMVPSSYGPKETTDRLVTEVTGKGLTIFARIDHAAGAAQVGIPLRPTELLIFGNAKAGTPLMQSNQAVGIDLPLKVLVREDAAGKTWLSYNDPRWIAKRHELGPGVDQTIDAMVVGLSAIAKKVTQRP
jgi:uncharacterized protein (DUF302 family)